MLNGDYNFITVHHIRIISVSISLAKLLASSRARINFAAVQYVDTTTAVT
ncbi:hypothetical protein GCM10008107_21530 [Psychrosphaera saromensis]|nr:hypothetical protein GCM10008107_21530 [Psychrosphaera saromensis]GLQ13339.1 hypothetical protein GCM10007917_07940 [Psychrosphaera saromensis]